MVDGRWSINCGLSSDGGRRRYQVFMVAIGKTVEGQNQGRLSAGAVVVLGTVIPLIIYLITLNPFVGFHDSAELALRAYQLGATHAPGAPGHTILGHLFGQVIADPAFATKVISVLSVSISVGIFAGLVYVNFGSLSLALAGSLSLAFVNPIWGNAIITELYGLSLVCLATAIVFGWRWLARGSVGYPWLMSVAYAFALSAHFANILLVPAFVFLLLGRTRQSWRNILQFLIFVAGSVLLIALLNILLAANQPPFGEFLPEANSNIMAYMSGAQHKPLSVWTAGFYLDRIISHGELFARYYLFLGVPLGLFGLYRLFGNQRRFSVFLFLVFAIYMGYFTLFGPGDYFTMVLPAYFVFSFWLVSGVHAFVERGKTRRSKIFACLLLLAVSALTMGNQLGSRIVEAKSAQTVDFASRAFQFIPPSSTVLVRWNEFTVLRYFQVIDDQRPDLTLMVPTVGSRWYPHGRVDDYLAYVDQVICDAPVVTNKLPDELLQRYDVELLPDNGNWYRLTQKAGATSSCRPE
jgi:hypothetical protein